MAQLSWIVLDRSGGQYEVGLYHGDKTRHLLVHIDRTPVIIDFNVRKSKQYTFYAGEELCELQVEKGNYEYSYNLSTNKTLNTPLNQANRQVARKYFWLSMALIAAMILIIALLVWIFVR